MNRSRRIVLAHPSGMSGPTAHDASEFINGSSGSSWPHRSRHLDAVATAVSVDTDVGSFVIEDDPKPVCATENAPPLVKDSPLADVRDQGTSRDPPRPTRQRQPMSHPVPGEMIVYAPTEPIDDFTALTSLPVWITADPVPHTHWALRHRRTSERHAQGLAPAT
jgi:hypothetical protein